MNTCQRCGANIPICFNVLLCDHCCDLAVANHKAEKQRQALGEIGDVEGAMPVVELEFIWQLK